MGLGVLSEAIVDFECAVASWKAVFTSSVCLSLQQMNESVVMGKSQFPFEVVTLLTFIVCFYTLHCDCKPN